MRHPRHTSGTRKIDAHRGGKAGEVVVITITITIAVLVALRRPHVLRHHVRLLRRTRCNPRRRPSVRRRAADLRRFKLARTQRRRYLLKVRRTSAAMRKRSSPQQPSPPADAGRRRRSNSSAVAATTGSAASDAPSFTGVLAIAKKNDRRRCVLLADNDFAGFRVERVLLDTGCGTHLLPLPDANSLAQLRQAFPAPCIWGLAQSADTFCVLTIERPGQDDGFQVRFCTGLLKSSPGVKVASLRFHLCADDLKAVTALKGP